MAGIGFFGLLDLLGIENMNLLPIITRYAALSECIDMTVSVDESRF